jgi:hypothetical protein
MIFGECRGVANVATRFMLNVFLNSDIQTTSYFCGWNDDFGKLDNWHLFQA